MLPSIVIVLPNDGAAVLPLTIVGGVVVLSLVVGTSSVPDPPGVGGLVTIINTDGAVVTDCCRLSFDGWRHC